VEWFFYSDADIEPPSPGDPTPEEIRIACRRLRLLGFVTVGRCPRCGKPWPLRHRAWKESTEARRRGCPIQPNSVGPLAERLVKLSDLEPEEEEPYGT